MAKLVGSNLVLSSEEMELLKNSKELEIIPNQEGIFLLIDKDLAVENEGKQFCVEVPLIEEQQKVIGLIKKTRMSDLVEGKFEQQLGDKEKRALLELVSSEKVFVFKLNDSYKKGIYRVKDEEGNEKTKKRGKRESENFDAEKKALPDYTLETDGFIATTNNERAKILSGEHKEDIEKGELKGLKSFDGIYYLIENDLLEKYMSAVLNSFEKKHETTLIELTKEINVSEELVRIVCEFLKEDGELLEKTKGQYTYIS
ncbi:MAG: hypothetical protein HN878_03125 [Candidatus Diapherotrites archaeon]|nr:hypothetical protein [Candidatus Diapherotrites archaeon]